MRRGRRIRKSTVYDKGGAFPQWHANRPTQALRGAAHKFDIAECLALFVSALSYIRTHIDIEPSRKTPSHVIR